MQKKLFFLSFCWLALSSFFWSDDEEKQLRSLLQTAEASIKKEEFAEAKESYSELISRVGVNTAQKYSVDWPTYVDIVMRYAEACEALGDLDEGEEALSRLLKRGPPQEQLPRIKLMRARFTTNRQSPGAAYIEMRSVERHYPKEEWKKQDLSFYRALEYSLNSYYDQLTQKAKRYLVTGHYSEALALYNEILEAIEAKYYPKACAPDSLIEKKIRFRLAESHYSQANYEQSLALCYNGSVVEDRIDREMLYLSALCYREKQEYEKALQLLQNYTTSGKQKDLDHYDHALFEIGIFHYAAGNLHQAYSYFEQLQQMEGKPKRVAALYLARIYLQQKKFEKVEALLTPLIETLASDDSLRYECYYLLGEAAYARGEYFNAKEAFEKSLPSQKAPVAWREQALIHLGWCLIRIGDEKQDALTLKQAEEVFKKLLRSKEQEAAALALSRVYLLQGLYFNNREAVKRVGPLLRPFHSLDALLLRAEAAEHYEEREALLKEATCKTFQTHERYADAWYERGLNAFREGLKNPAKGHNHFEMAALSLGNSFRYIELRDPVKAAHILKLEAKADAYLGSPITSLALLEKLLSDFNETAEDYEETLYLKGLIASRLPSSTYFSLAVTSLTQVAQNKGKYQEEALYVLGTLYFGQELYEKAKETFISLAEMHPTSPHASDAWFWAAEAAEKMGLPEHFTLHARVYQDYPLSSKASEAYFRQYAYDIYLAGNSEALKHLRAFPHRFPHSPLLVVAHYLIGMNEEHSECAKDCFEEAIKTFPLCLEEGKVPDAAFVYFRYQAMLELAQLYLEKNASNEALHLLNTIVTDFSTSDHPFTSLLTAKTPYPTLYEEAEYMLVQTYLQSGKKMRAQERLAKMLAHFEEAGIQEGYYLSQVWREQGELAHQCRDYDTALRCFEIAEECGVNYLTDEHRLSLLLLQSHAYRGKKEYDIAMRLLSKVINTEIDSPLRLKAMFFRAEVYELQGRPELAFRQLEAMAKKGGDWAVQAQEKLTKEYGSNHGL